MEVMIPSTGQTILLHWHKSRLWMTNTRVTKWIPWNQARFHPLQLDALPTTLNNVSG